MADKPKKEEGVPSPIDVRRIDPALLVDFKEKANLESFMVLACREKLTEKSVKEDIAVEISGAGIPVEYGPVLLVLALENMTGVRLPKEYMELVLGIKKDK